MKRTFIGLSVPRMIADRLAFLRGNLPGARWVDPEDYHLTLRFLGQLDNPTLDIIVQNLDQIAAEPFTLELASLGTFGHAKTRAIWMGLEPSAPLKALHGDVQNAVRHAGLPDETRKFTPHITLARLNGAPASVAAEALEAMSPPELPSFQVEHFSLYSSARLRGGGPYLVEEKFPLQVN